MFVKTFLKMFPPPKFLAMPYAGLDISDDNIRCVTYGSKFGHKYIKSFSSLDLPNGLLDGGDTKDQSKLIKLISDFAKKAALSYVKVSIPEEKAYLFETDVPMMDIHSIRQNIESKLEENVPLAAPDALFYFDLLPPAVDGGSLRASVSVVPRTYIEHIISILSAAGIKPVAFEVVPKALARVVIPNDSTETVVIVHIMEHKTGIYIVSNGVVCFTSTLSRESNNTPSKLSDEDTIAQEVIHINEYWVSRVGVSAISRVILVGRDALKYEKALGGTITELSVPVSVPEVWSNICDKKSCVPSIKRADSFAYAVAAGLAIQL